MTLFLGHQFMLSHIYVDFSVMDCVNANIMQISEAKVYAKVLPINDLFFNVETWQH